MEPQCSYKNLISMNWMSSFPHETHHFSTKWPVRFLDHDRSQGPSLSLTVRANSKVDWTLILLLSEFFFINSAAINTESFLFIPKTGNASPISAVLERTHPFYKRLHGNPMKVNDFFTPLAYQESARYSSITIHSIRELGDSQAN